MEHLNASNSSAPTSGSTASLALVISMTAVYGAIFASGVLGNAITCAVIFRNRSMHTATNYYLFSLAVSDTLLLVAGLPPELHHLWRPDAYLFGDALCVLQGLAAETAANATVLTIAAFTVERYVAICHPFLAHKTAHLSRAMRYIAGVWVAALCLAAPQALQFGVKRESLEGGAQVSRCTVVSNLFEHAFEISTFLIFIGPMTLITVLYVLIAVRLKSISIRRQDSTASSKNVGGSRSLAAQNRVVKMLIAVVVAFFICWAPFHAQRLLAVYLNGLTEPPEMAVMAYMVLMYISGILYFLSATINPVLYHIMSNKFREAFRKTIADACRSRKKRKLNQTYLILSKYPPSFRQAQGFFASDAAQITEIHADEQLKTRNKNKIIKARNMPSQSETTSSSTTSSTEQKVLDDRISVQNVSAISKDVALDRNSSEKSAENDVRLLLRFGMFQVFRKKQIRRRFEPQIYRQGSVDSGQTISNSSLQDVEELYNVEDVDEDEVAGAET